MSLGEGQLRLLRETMDMASIFMLGQLEGTQWLSSLEDLAAGDGWVVGVLRSNFSDDYFIDVVCSRCDGAAEELLRVLRDRGRAWANTSRLDLIQALLRTGDVILEDVAAFHVMEVDRDTFRKFEGVPSFLSFSVLDEHNIEELRDLLFKWDEARAAMADDMIMRGTAIGAWDGDRLVAVAATYAVTDSWWYLGSLFVDPEYRGRKVGISMSSVATEEALARAGRAYISVEVDNVRSIAINTLLNYRPRALSYSVLLTARG